MRDGIEVTGAGYGWPRTLDLHRAGVGGRQPVRRAGLYGSVPGLYRVGGDGNQGPGQRRARSSVSRLPRIIPA